MSESINLIALITEASLLVQLVMGILLLASIVCWVLIFRLSARLGTAKKLDEHFENWFWSGEDLAKLYQGIQNSPDRHGLANIFYIGFSEFLRMNKKRQPKDQIIDGVERKLRVGLGRQQQALESGLAVLASIGSVSPYIGLFGTVWGIMNAFLGLSMTDQVSLSAVAPGIAEALIATAMGLFAAIPAVLAYNHFTAKAATLYDSRALFCDEMTGMLQRETYETSSVPTAETAIRAAQNVQSPLV
ncbi:protein TolQ [Psychrobacter sp. FDAARGOS_221]|uniref:protein TolQ n=1 Tax=Psychrobacter sp. FDAARGOS_221 TaxID=1975705 RepID=UPI000BB59421|nr:protein TolQ [Psychrobacter sp. FDAARGOS_221]PNK59884.1 protein TolQ [Psychrobacter sp. FDAARGOS_221]